MKELEPNQCPRCGKGIPSDEHRGEYPGALSRIDDETEICSRCGTMEAFTGLWRGQFVVAEIDGTKYVTLDSLKYALGWWAHEPTPHTQRGGTPA